MQEPIKLAANSLDNTGGAVSGIEAADATSKINEAVAVHIFDDGAFSFRNKDGRRVIRGLHNRSVTAFHQLLRARPGNRRAKLNGRHGKQFSVLSSQFPTKAVVSPVSPAN